MTFAAIIRTSPSYASANIERFGEGSLVERDAAGSDVKFWVVDSTDPDAAEHDNVYVLKEGVWNPIGGGTVDLTAIQSQLDAQAAVDAAQEAVDVANKAVDDAQALAINNKEDAGVAATLDALIKAQADAADVLNAAQQTQLDAADTLAAAQQLEIDTAEAVNTAQQAQIDAIDTSGKEDAGVAATLDAALQAQITAANTAATALQAEIDAAEAVNTAQQAQLDAADTLNTAQTAAINNKEDAGVAATLDAAIQAQVTANATLNTAQQTAITANIAAIAALQASIVKPDYEAAESDAAGILNKPEIDNSVGRYEYLHISTAFDLNAEIDEDFAKGFLSVGSHVETHSYYESSNYSDGLRRGNARYTVIADASATVDNCKYIQGNGYQLEYLGTEKINVFQAGALGNISYVAAELPTAGATNADVVFDTERVQTAMTAFLHVKFPLAPGQFVLDTLHTRPNQILEGHKSFHLNGQETHQITGAKAGPVFRMTPVGYSYSFTSAPAAAERSHVVRFYDVSARNENHAVVEAHWASDTKFKDCVFHSKHASGGNTVVVRQSYATVFDGGNRITAQGDAKTFALGIYAQSNVLSFTGRNRITGGSTASAIDIGQCQQVIVEGVVTEITAGYGIRVSGLPTADQGQLNDAGLCLGVSVINNYLEQVYIPFSFGVTGSIEGLVVTGNVISNVSLPASGVQQPYCAIELGAVAGFQISENSIAKSSAGEADIRLYGTTSSGVRCATNGEYLRNSIRSSGGLVQDAYGLEYDFDATFTDTMKPRTAGTCLFRFIDNTNANQKSAFGKTMIGASRTYESPVYTAGDATATHVFELPRHEMGGVLYEAEIFDIVGDVTGCRCQVGSTVAATENINESDLGTIAANAKGVIELPISISLLRAGTSNKQVRFSSAAANGGGSYRVRLTYQL